MIILLRGVVLFSFFLLMACSGKESEAERKTEHKELYESVNAPLDKAKGVEQRLERAAEDEKEQIDRQSEQ